MWIYQKFKVKVLKFVYDELIKNRHDAGDNYVTLSTAVSKTVNKSIVPIVISSVVKVFSHNVFNKQDTEIRNTEATSASFKELSKLETKITKLINGEFVKEYSELMTYLHKLWNIKHQTYILVSQKLSGTYREVIDK